MRQKSLEDVAGMYGLKGCNLELRSAQISIAEVGRDIRYFFIPKRKRRYIIYFMLTTLYLYLIHKSIYYNMLIKMREFSYF